MASFDANSTTIISISFVAHANPACESPFVVVFVLWYLKDDDVVDEEEIRELLFSSSADDDEISSVDLVVMDWMDFSSTWMCHRRCANVVVVRVGSLLRFAAVVDATDDCANCNQASSNRNQGQQATLLSSRHGVCFVEVRV
jgi:hypothetical protein